jgi:RNA polymerase sigma-70 factor (ECF subfamily)
MDEDAQLVARIRGGDLCAFEALYHKYKRSLYHTALAITGNVGAAEEALQDCFVRAYAALDRVDATEPLSPWLHRIIVNVSYNWIARTQRWPLALDAFVDRLLTGPASCPEHYAETSEMRSIVREAVAALGVKQRSVVVLFYFQGFSLAETAYILDCPIGTVKSRLHRASQVLRCQLLEDRRLASELAYATL